MNAKLVIKLRHLARIEAADHLQTDHHIGKPSYVFGPIINGVHKKAIFLGQLQVDANCARSVYLRMKKTIKVIQQKRGYEHAARMV